MDRVVVTRLLSSKKEDEASAAQHLLADAAARASQAERDEAIAVLVAALEKDERRIARVRRTLLGVLVGIASATLAVAVTLIALGYGSRFPFPVLLFPLQFLYSVAIVLKDRKNCSLVRARAGLAFAEHDDLRAVGPLVEAFGANVPAAPLPVVSGALKRLLPRVSPGDTNLLNDRQRHALNTLLREWDPVKVVARPEEVAEGIVTLLRLAALVGDKGAELAVAAVRGRQATTDRDRHVVGVACVSIEEIRARLDGRAPVTAPSFPFRP